MSPENERVCIQCTDFLNAPSLIRCCTVGTFVEDSQEVKERIQYLLKIYPCTCKNRSNEENFDVKDVTTDTSKKKPSLVNDWPIGNPDQAQRFIDEVERLNKDK